jgi:hypothetical protein
MRSRSVAKLLSAIIHKKHGWAVAEQFDDTWDGDEELYTQNINALEYIKQTLEDIVSYDSDLFQEHVIQEIEDYVEELTEYIEGDEDEDTE